MREKQERKIISNFLSLVTGLGEFLFTKTGHKSRKAGLGKDAAFSFVNIELEMPETFKQNVYTLENMQYLGCE